jgi:hypothetical protein
VKLHTRKSCGVGRRVSYIALSLRPSLKIMNKLNIKLEKELDTWNVSTEIIIDNVPNIVIQTGKTISIALENLAHSLRELGF